MRRGIEHSGQERSSRGTPIYWTSLCACTRDPIRGDTGDGFELCPQVSGGCSPGGALFDGAHRRDNRFRAGAALGVDGGVIDRARCVGPSLGQRSHRRMVLRTADRGRDLRACRGDRPCGRARDAVRSDALLRTRDRSARSPAPGAPGASRSAQEFHQRSRRSIGCRPIRGGDDLPLTVVGSRSDPSSRCLSRRW